MALIGDQYIYQNLSGLDLDHLLHHQSHLDR